MVVKSLTRNAGHPWDGRPGFDLLEVEADTAQQLQAFITAAALKHWTPWINGTCLDTGRPGALLYKPCDVAAPWSDHPNARHPGCVRLQ